MTETLEYAALLKLQTWMSSSFPIGAYTCSHGIETAISDGRLHDVPSTHQWLQTILQHGSLWNDAILLSHAWHAVHDQHNGIRTPNIRTLTELNQLSLALQAGAERHLETTQLGAAFLSAARAWPETDTLNWHALGSELAFPVIVGAAGALHDLPLAAVCASTLQSTLSNLAWIATRLLPLGQSDCLSIIVELEADITSVSKRATSATLDDLGSCALLCDLASLQHETLRSRVCQT